jgi:hypothetical protein
VSAPRGVGKVKAPDTVVGGMAVQHHRAQEEDVQGSIRWTEPSTDSSSCNQGKTQAAPTSPPAVDHGCLGLMTTPTLV